MKEALKGMKEQAARMAAEAQQAAAAAAAQREEADAALASVNSELEAERKRITSLQVPHPFTFLISRRKPCHLQEGGCCNAQHCARKSSDTCQCSIVVLCFGLIMRFMD